jgi:exosortase
MTVPESPAMTDEKPQSEPGPADRPTGLSWTMLVAAAALVAAVTLTYWPTMVLLSHRWWNEPDYLHGFLVPVFSGWLLWRRREMLSSATIQGSWWGLALLAVAGIMRWASAYYYYVLLDSLSIIPSLGGVVLLVGGWRAVRWAWPSLAFLVFMMPLPEFIAHYMSLPLQRVGTIVSTYILQTLGVPAISQGNVIVLSDAQLGVVEACSGLRMMVLFFAVCVGAAFVSKRPPLDRLVMVLSAAPIALAANVFRITLTGVLHQMFSHKVADAVFHDFAGWVMMPTAVLLLWVEMALLAHLLVEPPPAGPLALNRNPSVAARRSQPRRPRRQGRK